MNRQKKLLLLVGVLAALCVVIAIVTGVQKHIDTVTTVDEEIVAADPEALTAVSWTKEGATLSFTQADGTWQDASDAAFPVDQEKMADFLSHFESVHASFIIENVEDFAQYGLDDPSCTITLTSADGDTVLELGDFSTMDEKRYVTLGDGTVYLIEDDLAGYDVTDRDELMRQDVIPGYDTLDGIVATGETAFTVEHRPDEELCYTDAYEYYLNDGGSYEPLDSGKVEGLVDTLNALDRSDYATYTADEASLAGYGLDAPALTFTVTTTLDGTQESHALAFGQDGDGNHYLRMDDSPIVYRVDADAYADDVAAAGYDTLRPDEVLALNWDTVESIDFTIDDSVYTAVKSGDTWTINDSEVEFGDVQDAIDGLTVNTFNDETADKKQEIAFTVHLDSEAFPEVSVAVYQYDGENCLVQLDGVTLGLAARSLAVDLTEAVNAITLGLA